MRAIQDKIPDENFTPRSGSTPDQIQVEVPDVTGMSPRRAAERLVGAGFYDSIGDPRASDKRAGTVAETSPSAGESAPRGRRSSSTPPPAEAG